MSKYAVLSLTEALEHELEGTNVGVTALCPGPIATSLAQGARHQPGPGRAPPAWPRARATAPIISEARSGAPTPRRSWPSAWTGIDSKLVGERVIEVIRNKIFYAFVSAVPRNAIKARHRRIEGLERWSSPVWMQHFLACTEPGQSP